MAPDIQINNVHSYQKSSVAKTIRGIADWIEHCGNKSVSVQLQVTFESDKEPKAGKKQ